MKPYPADVQSIIDRRRMALVNRDAAPELAVALIQAQKWLKAAVADGYQAQFSLELIDLALKKARIQI